MFPLNEQGEMPNMMQMPNLNMNMQIPNMTMNTNMTNLNMNMHTFNNPSDTPPATPDQLSLIRSTRIDDNAVAPCAN